MLHCGKRIRPPHKFVRAFPVKTRWDQTFFLLFATR
ncbi:hypothetical protein ACVIF9_005908 [Bradyrhizobium sp. USDA 4350]